MQVKSTCSIPGCDKPAKTRGWCYAHYANWRRHGDPIPTKPGGRRFSQNETQTICDWYRARIGKPLELAELAALLGRDKATVCAAARRLGLTDIRRTTVQPDEFGYMPADARKLKWPPGLTAKEIHQRRSEAARRRIEEHGHPRGSLGMKHSAETLRVLAEKSRQMNARRTPEEKRVMADKATATKIERYGSGAPHMANENQPYSRTKGGKRADLGDTYYRSAWEANYARYLNWLKDQGEIVAWEYEADVFVFHGETRGAVTYRPDFKITERDGSVVYHEVKGWMDGPSRTRLKRMKKHYPEVTVIVIGEDEYKALRKWRGLIPEWEGK